ncbi:MULTISPECIES: phosphate ABC transporter permease PstA [unclassified Nocardioides]|uniref:phosphate ABC transporter permease PstA n=1 Tax=unclassified Nocardioides TaxID=2615069 RepID=UPI000702C3BA|nr:MULTISPECIES: phosphate ABC transporter permease PstA [unclassified Nocardioides]KQP65638.1 phosphate ABC transporter permease [Nocardioides sp. Leaf285]KQQ42900.1 phosphate ABC transporter permease [Nocardioides sp. Leaf307]
MTDLQTRPSPAPGESITLTRPQLPGWAPAVAALVAFGLAALVGLLLGWGPVPVVVVGWILLVVALPAWSTAVEGSRKGTDRLVTTVVWTTFAVAMMPLVAVIWEVISRGAPALSVEFLTFSQDGVLGEGGGIYHAIMGTLIITAIATVISVPIGVLAAIYLIEYGKGSRLARVLTFLVDVMTGIPSIVAGLFALALFTLIFGPGTRMAIGGSIALSVLMIPIVVRATEEMLKLVPDELREASYALGVPKWRTITKVVLPTAIGGIITGVTLAVARVAGETAPLLLIVGTLRSTNFNPFEGSMATLPVLIFSEATRGGLAEYVPFQVERAWGAALVLITIVMLLNVIARVLGSFFAPKTGR